MRDNREVPPPWLATAKTSVTGTGVFPRKQDVCTQIRRKKKKRENRED